ncbi:hypothetical protein ACVBIL_01870 [Shewanella sp. 125m-7]
MSNNNLLEQVTDDNRAAFKQVYGEYIQWNNELIKAVGVVEGFNRAELVANYLRGAQINCDDTGKQYDDAGLYYQFSYALAQLMGHSDKRIPKQTDYASWLVKLEPAANAA